jgi:hypothetical protein
MSNENNHATFKVAAVQATPVFLVDYAYGCEADDSGGA